MLCENENKKDLLDFLKNKSTENCFFIGDIENFNLDDDFMDIWKFETSNKISSVLLRYYKYYLLTIETVNDLKLIAQIIEDDKNCISISGIESSIDHISKFIKIKKIKRTYLAELNSNSFNLIQSNAQVHKADINDIDELFEFQKSIEEFSFDERNRESFGKEISTNTGSIYYIRKNGRIVSSATLTAENSINGTVIGVATDPEYRNRGFAKACMTEICKSMIGNKKNVVLFYNNPDAGKLYKELGFVDVAKWSMATIR
jgi:uncharacterized protein